MGLVLLVLVFGIGVILLELCFFLACLVVRLLDLKQK